MAGPLNVSHIIMLSQTDTTTNLRVGRLPQGPTLYFRILQYSLMKEIIALQRKPHSPGKEYHNAPLLVLNNLPVESSHGKLVCSMLQNMFPTINTNQVKLVDVRRVVLFHYDREQDTLEFRHYLIKVKAVGLSKSVKRLVVRSEIPDLSNFVDAAEYVLKAEANLSDSEVEPDSVITLGQNYLGVGNTKAQQRSINLQEIGPRMTLRLVKVSEGLNTGKALYHVSGSATHEDEQLEVEDEEEESFPSEESDEELEGLEESEKLVLEEE